MIQMTYPTIQNLMTEVAAEAEAAREAGITSSFKRIGTSVRDGRVSVDFVETKNGTFIPRLGTKNPRFLDRIQARATGLMGSWQR